MNLKLFGKQFIIFFVIFTVLLVPVQFGWEQFTNKRIFTGTESLAENIDYLVDKDGPYYDLFKNSKRINILVLGDNDKLTDTIMLASYDTENQRVDIISVPRDTYYPRSKYKSAAAQKINAVYQNGGAVGAAKAVSEVLMGIPINYYAVIEFSDVEAIVDEIGGVPMNIPNISNKGGMYYNDPYDTPPLKIAIPAGQQTLDGKHAVQFLRFRKGYPEGDIGRVKAQQEFIKSAMKQAIKSGLPGAVSLGLKTVDSDITLGMAAKIATKAVNLKSENMNTYLAPGGPKTVNGASYWFIDSKQVGALIEEIYADPDESSDEGNSGDNNKTESGS
ncbi:LCP family protein [Clostridium aminobutyricum]|uniref:LCP family protein n=1 Tax=Clostridium aminobutyricum TaxID=33953 RepID=A0A939IJY3_CLOAM|nr:LCP family protein [Clostridium aminobutyricum]MBN7774029.1 LCP family protein [Clostridium aminobutyricum]